MSKSALATVSLLAAHALLLINCGGDDAAPTQGSAGTTSTTAGTASAGTPATQAGSGGVSSGGAAGSLGSGGSSGSAVATSGTGTGGALGGAAGSGAGGKGGAGGAAGGSAGTTSGGAGGGGPFAITSTQHAEGAVFADSITCAGKGVSPPLAWTAGPAGTKSYAITFFDTTLVDMNSALGYHWVMWDIPAATMALPAELPSGATLTTPVMAKQLAPANPFDGFPKDTFFGPCPNATGNGSNTDTYAFTIYALNVEHLTGDLTSVKNVEAAIKAATPLATAKLTGKSSAKAN